MATHTSEVEKTAFSYVATLERLLERLPVRSREIVKLRFGVPDGKIRTLEEIGKQHGITRERVRQVVGSALTMIASHKEYPEVVEIMKHIEQALGSKSGVMKVDHLVEKLAGKDKAERGALAVFLESLPVCGTEKESDDRERVCFLNGFLFSEWKEIHDTVIEVLKESEVALSLEDLYSLFSKRVEGFSQDRLLHFLLVSKTIRQNVFGKWGLAEWSEIKPRGMREKAHLVLKTSAEPLHFRDIARKIDEYGLHGTKKKKSHPQTVHNELIKDQRFVLVGRGIYALSDWGYKKGTVRDVITEILREAGKPLSRDEVIERVFKIRQVEKSTVVINLNTYFARAGKNVYTLKKDV